MLTEDRKNIHRLKNLLIDTSLKKHTQKTIGVMRADTDNSTVDISTFNNIMVSDGAVMFGGDSFDRQNNWDSVWDGIPFKSERYYSSKWEKKYFKAKIWFKSLFFKGRESPIQYFKNIKESISELDNIDEKIVFLNKIIVSLRATGQTNMLDIAISQKKILELERVLKESSYKKFITEENLVAFTLKCKKGLRLDYIKEFNRIIPESVIKNRDNVEELRVFDNYFILHYDPDVKKVNLVEKKDPILFGVIKNSNKLYFIDDWIDEKCDLTYNKIIKELNIDEEIC